MAAEVDDTCRICGEQRPASGPCPHCGDLPEASWPSSTPGDDDAGPGPTPSSAAPPSTGMPSSDAAPTQAPPPAWGSAADPEPTGAPPPAWSSPAAGAPAAGASSSPGAPPPPGGSPPPPPPPPAGPVGRQRDPDASSNAGCRRAAIIVGIVVLVLLVIVVAAGFLFVRSVSETIDEGGFTVDIDEGGDLSLDNASSYGDDPELDALWDDCEDGDLQACDELYFQAPLFSDYESFGETCGDREPAMGGTCDGGGSEGGDGVFSGEQPQSYGDDPALDNLWDLCEGGDSGACDDLFFSSPFDTAYEEFGATCGRRQEAAGGQCES